MAQDETNRGSTPKPVFDEVSLDLINDPQRPIRSDLSPESVADLAKSIKQFGIIQPLTVKKVGEKFEVVTGHRRLVAAEIAGLAKVPILITEAPGDIQDILKVHENLYRADVNPVDEADYINYLLKTHKLSPTNVAQLIGKSNSYVSDRLSILNYPTELKEALEGEKIVFSVARELAKIPDKTTMGEYLNYAIKNGITPATAQQWSKDYREMSDRVEESPEEPKEVAPTPKGQEYSVDCALCNGGVALKDSKAIYVHGKCLQEFQSVVDKKE